MARNFFKEKQDKLGEKSTRDFLKKYFYNTVEDYEEVVDKERQLSGIDSTFKINGVEYLCDEKVALDFTNMQKGYKLNTFCLELSFLSRQDERMEGWFTSDNCHNNSYLLVWIDKSDNNTISSCEEIRKAEIALVMKQDIYDYLASIGWDKDKLRQKELNIRNNNDKKFGNMKKNGCVFSYPAYLPEKPINLLLSRDIYKNMPHTIFRTFDV